MNEAVREVRFARARRLLTHSGDSTVDTVLAAAVVAMIGFGVVMVYSSSSYEATVRFSDAQYFIKRQAVFAVLSLLAMWLLSRLDYRLLRPLTYPMLFVVIGLLTATVAGFGHSAGNAHRWLALGPVRIQPSELAKVVLVLWLAYSLSKKGERVKSFWVGLVPHLLVVGILMALCLKQPDFGSAVVLFCLTLMLLFVAGVRLPHLGVTLAIFAVAGAALVRFSAYRYGRFLSWMNMSEHRLGLAYQPFQSVMSFGSGGIFGLGLGRGMQVLYLPEAHNDFIAAIIGEELGFVGVVGMCGMYTLIVARGIKVATQATDDYGAYIAFGISALLAMQVLLNLAVTLAILPTKGLTLPFISYGGSSLLVSGASIGILLSVSRRRQDHRATSADEGPGSVDDIPESASAVVATAAESGGSGW